jgi:hypothetical protein
MPEWYMVNIALAGLSLLGVLWKPLFLALPLLAITAGLPLLNVIKTVSVASIGNGGFSRSGRLRLQLLTGILHVVQPMVRLYGRLRHGLTPWRRRGDLHFIFPLPRLHTLWHEAWQAPEKRLEGLEAALRARGAIVHRGGDYDRWDLEVVGGLLGVLRNRMAIEEHGAGRQLVRLKSWPRPSLLGLTLPLVSAILASLAALDGAWVAFGILGLGALLISLRAWGDCALATACYLDALHTMEEVGSNGYLADSNQVASARTSPGPEALQNVPAANISEKTG